MLTIPVQVPKRVVIMNAETKMIALLTLWWRNKIVVAKK